jgi:hypothetical protein
LESQSLQKKLLQYRSLRDARPSLSLLDRVRYFHPSGGDAIEFFVRKIEEVESHIADIRSRPLAGSGVAFVTFATSRDSLKFQQLLSEKSSSHLRILERNFKEPDSVTSADIMSECSLLNCTEWSVTKAVTPAMVNWQSLSIPLNEKAVRRIAYLTGFLIFLMFLTTPIAMLGGLQQLLIAIGVDVSSSHSQLTAFLPSALLLLIATAVPSLIEASSSLAKYNTKPHRETAVLSEVFAFLFFSAFILPTFMLTTIAALAVFLSSESKEYYSSDYIFPNSVMFVALVLQGGLIGSGVELLLPGDLISRYVVGDGGGDQKRPLFHLGISYAYCLTFFAISLFYCSCVPFLSHSMHSIFALIFSSPNAFLCCF